MDDLKGKRIRYNVQNKLLNQKNNSNSDHRKKYSLINLLNRHKFN